MIKIIHIVPESVAIDAESLNMPNKKLSKLTPPLGIERDYQKRIRKIVNRVKTIINNEVVNALPSIMDITEAVRPDTRKDSDIGEAVKELFVATRISASEQITDFEIEQMVQGTAGEINTWNKAQITRVLKQGLGVDPFASEPWLAQEMNNFVTTNVNLIKNVNQAFIAETESVVFEGMRRGLRHEQIAKQINGFGKDELGRKSKFNNAKTRANLIGRDQTNKMNGQLTKLRQENIGVTKYIWRTVGDSRVRDHHASRNGKTYTWAKGSEVGTHPGDEIQCRCYAEPVLDDLLK
jgi:SPP1 gp7 family putative phage head morphogenesis protein